MSGQVIKPGGVLPQNLMVKNQLWRIRPYVNQAASAWESVPSRGWSSCFSAHQHPYSLRTNHFLKMSWRNNLVIFKADCYTVNQRHVVRILRAGKHPPLRIENYSKAVLGVQQTGVTHSYVLQSGEVMDYAFDDSSPAASSELSFRALTVQRHSSAVSVHPYCEGPAVLKYLGDDGHRATLYILPVPEPSTATMTYVVADTIFDLRQV